MDKGKITSGQISEIKNFIRDRDIPFYFIPSAKLREMILKDEEPHIKKLNKNLKVGFLEGKPYLFHQDLIIKYLEGTIDENHKFLFDNGEIRVLGNDNIKI